MALFDPEHVAIALAGVCDKLDINVDNGIQRDYQNGLLPNLLHYEKLGTVAVDLPIIQKILISVQTYLNHTHYNQYCHYYDIIRSSRHVYLIQLLNNALATVTQRAVGFKIVLDRLICAKTFDSFESILYELIIASNYALAKGNRGVEFIGETNKKTPDLEIISEDGRLFVECKKFNRAKDFVFELEELIDKKVSPTLDMFQNLDISAIIEIAFHIDPVNISETLIRKLAVESLETGAAIINGNITIFAERLNEYDWSQYVLYPSAKYYWERYRYKSQKEWFGLCTQITPVFKDFQGEEKKDTIRRSTWLAGTHFECVAKWKITDEAIIKKYKQFGYNRLFKGLKQLQAYGPNSILHVWLEKNGTIGHRQDELLQFREKLLSRNIDGFLWIVFNETKFDLSISGRLDLIENAHFLSGIPSGNIEPPITRVFTPKGGEDEELNTEFGIGFEYPDLD